MRNRVGDENLKTVPFIPLFARLGIELSQFEEEERGGLTGRQNMLKELAVTAYKRHNEEYQRLIDGAFLSVMTRLREMNLFKKEDIRKYELIWILLCSQHFFPAQRFRYLIDWDPDCLAKCIMRGSSDLGMGGSLPIHHAATNSNNIGGFQTVFEAGMQHFILFQPSSYCNRLTIENGDDTFGIRGLYGILNQNNGRDHHVKQAIIQSFHPIGKLITR